MGKKDHMEKGDAKKQLLSGSTEFLAEASDYDMQCTHPVRLRKNLDPVKYPDGLEVPCGRCLSCRIKTRQEWSMRCLHELSQYDDSMFITLTYDEKNLPPNGSLVKHDLQKFFKRLRKAIDRDTKGKKIRYFAAGEYGEQHGRPHYHAIVFGIGLNPIDMALVKDAWRFGLIHFGVAENDSIRYVAQYIDKKYTGDMAVLQYDDKNKERVFKLSSLGIGKKFVDKNADQIRQQLKLTVKGIPQSIPRYYMNRLGIPSEVIQVKALEKEKELVEELTGYSDLTRDQAYRALKVSEIRSMEDTLKSKTLNRENHVAAKVALKKRKF